MALFYFQSILLFLSTEYIDLYLYETLSTFNLMAAGWVIINQESCNSISSAKKNWYQSRENKTVSFLYILKLYLHPLYQRDPYFVWICDEVHWLFHFHLGCLYISVSVIVCLDIPWKPEMYILIICVTLNAFCIKHCNYQFL